MHACDNYVRIFYFTCWIRYGYSLQDLRGTNRTAGSSPSLHRLPGPGPRRGGAGRVRLRTLRRPTGPHAPGPPRYGLRPIQGGASCRAAKPNGRPIPRFTFPRTVSAPLLTSRSSYPLARRRGMTQMSISASEREDWAGSEPDHFDSSGPSDLQEELMRVLSKAVQELELTWSPSEEPVRSKLDCPHKL